MTCFEKAVAEKLVSEEVEHDGSICPDDVFDVNYMKYMCYCPDCEKCWKQIYEEVRYEK